HAVDPPAPRIMLTRTDISGTQQPLDITEKMQSVVVGQRIVLTAKVPEGTSKSSERWLNLPGKTVGGFDVINTATVSRGKKVELPRLNSPDLTFFWVDSGDSRQVTYEYTASNGLSNRATATFNVKGLTGDLVLADTRTNRSGVQVLLQEIRDPEGEVDFVPVLKKTGVSVAGFPDPVGIFFESKAAPPSGAGDNQSFIWVQLLDDLQTQRILRTGSVTSTLARGSLDNFYPYPSLTPTGAI